MKVFFERSKNWTFTSSDVFKSERWAKVEQTKVEQKLKKSWRLTNVKQKKVNV